MYYGVAPTQCGAWNFIDFFPRFGFSVRGFLRACALATTQRLLLLLFVYSHHTPNENSGQMERTNEPIMWRHMLKSFVCYSIHPRFFLCFFTGRVLLFHSPPATKHTHPPTPTHLRNFMRERMSECVCLHMRNASLSTFCVDNHFCVGSFCDTHNTFCIFYMMLFCDMFGTKCVCVGVIV